MKRVEQIPRGPGQAIEPRHQNRIARLEPIARVEEMH
jgi:hypothetical protein